MFIQFSRALCALVALSSISNSVLAQQADSTVSIEVADPTGAVISNAIVSLRDREAGAVFNAQIRQGVYSTSVTSGTYTLTVQAPGFGSDTRELTVAPGASPAVRIVLLPESVSTSLNVTGRISEIPGSVTKTSTPLLETPQSVSIVSRQQLTEQAPMNMQEALRYAPGVRAEQYGVDARGDWASIRGGSFVQFLNGTRMLFGFYNNVRPEPFALEQIEVMRGPASVLFGQGGFGGVINMISKRPLSAPRGEVQIQFGSFGRKQLGVDVTGPVGQQEKFFYRFVGVGRDSGTQVNYVPDDRLLVAPSFTWQPTARTRLTVLTNFQDDRMGSSVGFFPWRGTLQPHPLGRIHPSTFISEPGFDEYNSSQRSAGYLFEHHFSSALTARQNLNYSHSRVSYQSLYSAFAPQPAFNADDRTITRVIYLNKPEANSPTVDTHIEWRHRTGFIRHTVLAGYDYQQATITGTTAFANTTAIDVFSPVYGNYDVPRLSPFPKSTQSQHGVYVQDQLRIGEHWSALLGLRRDQASAETFGNAASRLDSGATTGRAGLVYLTGFGLAPYFSFTESFLPVAGFNFFNEPFKPQRARQWETGIKYEPGGGRTLMSLALFDLTETNRRTPDPANPANSIQVGEAQSRGVEAEIRTRTFRGVDVLASWTYNLARITQSNTADLGKRLATMPLHMGSLWATRGFRIGNSSWLTIGPGIRFTGQSWDGMDALETPGYTLFDAMAAWDNSRWRVSVNAANIGDRIHLTACLARGDCFFGARRNVVGTLSYRF